MAHASINYPTKKALTAAVKAGRPVSILPGPFGARENGTEYVEGPWEFHRWWATVTMQDGRIVKVK